MLEEKQNKNYILKKIKMFNQLKEIWRWLKRKIPQLKVSNYVVELALIAIIVLELVYNLRWLIWGCETEYIVDIQFVLLPFAASRICYGYQKEYFKPLTLYAMYTLGKQFLINGHVISANAINFTDILITILCLFCVVYLIARKVFLKNT